MPAAIVPAIGAAGSVVSAVGGKNAQKSATKAANQASQGENQLLGAEAGSIDDITNSYFGSGGTQSGINSLMSYLTGQQGQAYTSPYTSSANSAAGGLSNYTNGNMSAAQGTASQLANFNGLQPAQLNALQTTLGNSGRSTVNTLMSQLGGTANPNALAQSLLDSNNSNALNSTIQLGSQAAGEQLAGLQSAGQLQSGLSGQQLSGAQSGADLYGTLSGQNLSYGQGNQSTQAQLYGQQTGLLGSALSGEQGMAQLYGQAGQNAAQTAQSYGNPFASGLSGLSTGISGLFGSGAGGNSSSGTYNFGSGNNTASVGSGLAASGLDYGG